MPFRRNTRRRYQGRMRLNPIQSVKNQIAQKLSYAGASANNIFNIATVVDVGAPTKITGVECPVGSHVFSVYVTVDYIVTAASTAGTCDICVVKLRAGQVFATEFTNCDWTNLGLAAARNQIIKSYMTVHPTEDAGKVHWSGQIPIPKHMQRMRDGDVLMLVFNAANAGTLAIGARYKYYQ